MYSVSCLCLIVAKHGLSGQIFIKVPSMKFYENLSSGGHADTCGEAD